MLAKVYSCASVGLESAVVEVEADLNPLAPPSVTLVGPPDAAVKESTERCARCDLQLRVDLPQGRLTVNLAPADGEGGARLRSAHSRRPVDPGRAGAAGHGRPPLPGELSLDGSVRHVEGVLPMAHVAKELGYKSVIVPQPRRGLKPAVEGIDVYPVDTLGQAVAPPATTPSSRIAPTCASTTDLSPYVADFQDIKGSMFQTPHRKSPVTHGIAVR